MGFNHNKKNFFLNGFLLCVFLLISLEGFSQNRKLDSLFRVLSTHSADSNRVNTWNLISDHLWRSGSFDTAVHYAREAALLSAKIHFEKGKANAFMNFGTINWYQGKYPEALKNYFDALAIFKKAGDKRSIANTYLGLGNVYQYQSNYPAALVNYFSSLNIQKELLENAPSNEAKEKIKKRMTGAYNNIGNIYETKGNYAEALKYYFSSLELSERVKDSVNTAKAYNNIGGVYYYMKNFNEALKNYQIALKIKLAVGDKIGLSSGYANIANVYSEKGDYDAALKNKLIALSISEEIGEKQSMAVASQGVGYVYMLRNELDKAIEYDFIALRIFEDIGDLDGASNLYINLAGVWMKQKKYKEARLYLTKGADLAQQIGSGEHLMKSSLGLTLLDSISGDYKSALVNYKNYINARDSLTNQESTKKAIQIQMQYDFDRQQAADSLKNEEAKKREQIKHDQEIQQQKIYSYGGAIGFVLMLAVALVSFRAYRGKQRANEIIAGQKELVEEKQKEILDSIHYAVRIQKSLLPTEFYIQRNLKRLNKS